MSELPLYSLAPSSNKRHVPAQTLAHPVHLVAKPTCCMTICIVVLLFVALVTVVAIETSRARSHFSHHVNKQP